MKKFLSIILCVLMLPVCVPSFGTEAAAAQEAKEIVFGANFERQRGVDALPYANIDYKYPGTQDSTSRTFRRPSSATDMKLSYETMTLNDGSSKNVFVIESQTGGYSSMESQNIDESAGVNAVEFEFKLDAPAKGNFFRTQLRGPSDQAIILIKMNYDTSSPSDGQLEFYNKSGTTANPATPFKTGVSFKLGEWNHIEFRLKKAKDAGDNKLYYYVTLNGNSVVDDSDVNAQGVSQNYFSNSREGHVIKYPNIYYPTDLGAGKIYIDNWNLIKYYERAELSSLTEDNGKLKLSFTKSMNEASFANNVTLYEGADRTPIPFTGSLTSATMYEITPAIALKGGWEYTVAVSDKIECTDGPMVPGEKSVKIPMSGDITITSSGFSVDSAAQIGEGGVSFNLSLANSSGSSKDVYTALTLFKNGAMIKSDIKKITVPTTGADADLSVGAKGDRAVFQLLDLDLKPLCDKQVLNGSLAMPELSGIKNNTPISGSYSSSNDVITISGKANPHETVLAVSAVKSLVSTSSGENVIFDVAKLKSAMLTADGISTLSQVTADKDGYFEYTYKNDNGRFDTDTYTAVVINSNGVSDVDFEYTNPLEIDRERGYINSETDPQTMMNLIKRNKKIFDLTSSLANHNSAKDVQVGELLINERPSAGYADTGEIEIYLNKAITLSRIDESPINLALLKSFGTSFSIDTAVLSDAAREDEAKYLVSILSTKKYTAFAPFEADWAEAKIITAVSFAGITGTLQTLITSTYADKIKPFRLAEIENKYKEIEEKKNVFSKFLHTKFTTIDAIYKAFEKAVLETPIQSVPTTGSDYTGEGSNGGGGGGGGGGIIIPNTDKKPEENPENNPDNQPTDTEPTPDNKPVFNDIEKAGDATEGILGLHQMGVIHGDGNGNFRPFDGIKREETIKILVSAFDIVDESATSEFVDIPKEHWSYKFVSSAYKYGLVQGIGANAFGSGSAMSRQDLFTLIYRLAEKQGMVNEELKKPQLYDDYYEIAPYARDAVNYISNVGLGIVIENNKFNPGADITRAEVASTVWGFLKAVKE